MEASRASAARRSGRGPLLILSALGLIAALIALRSTTSGEAELPPVLAAAPPIEAGPGSASFEEEVAEAARLIEEHRYDQAEPLLFRARALRPNAAEPHYLSSRSLMGQRELDRAEAELERALELEPDNARYVLGMAQVVGKRLAVMEDSFAKLSLASRGKSLIDRAIELDAGLLDARLARLLYCMLAPSILGGGSERAHGEVSTITELDEAVGFFAAGWLAEQEERLEQAEAHYRDSLELNPAYPRTYYRLGNLLLAQERFEEALVLFDAGLELEPRSPDCHVGKGQSLAGLARHDEALVHFRSGGEIDPKLAGAFFQEALCTIETGGTRAATRRAFSRFLELATGEDAEQVEIAQRWLERHASAQ